jgi:hypothetical protein
VCDAADWGIAHRDGVLTFKVNARRGTVTVTG